MLGSLFTTIIQTPAPENLCGPWRLSDKFAAGDTGGECFSFLLSLCSQQQQKNSVGCPALHGSTSLGNLALHVTAGEGQRKCYCRNNVVHMLRAKLRARVCSCGESIPVLKSGVWSSGIREMLSLSNCINTRTRTKLSEVRNVTIFFSAAVPTRWSKGKPFESWDGGATYTAKRRVLNSEQGSEHSRGFPFKMLVPLQIETFCQRNQLTQVLRHFSYPNPLLFILRVVINGNPSSLFL